MTKKTYEHPVMKEVQIQQQAHILNGSPDVYGMNNTLQNEEVNSAWVRGSGQYSVWDDDWSN